jgi:drug/metabolite transporter (DMT)-like permease
MAPWLLTWRGKVAQVPRHDRWVLFGMSFFGNFLFTLCMLYGVAHTSATAAGIIMSLLPAVIALISAWVLREHLTRSGGLTIMLAVLGVMSLSLNKNDAGQSLLGNTMMVGALLCEAFYVVGAKYLSKGYSPKQVAVAMNTFGLILTTPLALTQLGDVAWSQISVARWALMVFYAVAASQIAPWLWFNGLKWIPANRAGVMTVALPLTAAIIGVTWFREVWTIYHTVAFACALSGIVLMAFSKSTEQSHPH